MIKRRIIKLSAVLLAILMSVSSAIVAFAESETSENNIGQSSGAEQTSNSKKSKYDKFDINELTGNGQEPEELSVSAGAEYLEKAWYEYITYSEHAVSSYRLDDDTRLLFYDPYTYCNAMIMDVNFDATSTQFDTMSSYSVSHTNSKSIEACVASTDTYTSATQTSGRDVTGSNVESSGSSKTTYNHSVENKTTGKVTNEQSYKYKPKDYDTSTYGL